MTNKGGRPPKVLTLTEATQIQDKIVYGLCDKYGSVFYIGKTVNPKKRFANYKNKEAHGNKELKQLLDRQEVFVKILSFNPLDIMSEESRLIGEHQNQIVNIVGVDFKFIGHQSKPWFAGTGVKCPSDGLMATAVKGTGKKVKKEFTDVHQVRNLMTDAQRCVFEIGVYMKMLPSAKKHYTRWLESCKYKMMECIKNAG